MASPRLCQGHEDGRTPPEEYGSARRAAKVPPSRVVRNCRSASLVYVVQTLLKTNNESLGPSSSELIPQQLLPPRQASVGCRFRGLRHSRECIDRTYEPAPAIEPQSDVALRRRIRVIGGAREAHAVKTLAHGPQIEGQGVDRRAGLCPRTPRQYQPARGRCARPDRRRPFG